MTVHAIAATAPELLPVVNKMPERQVRKLKSDPAGAAAERDWADANCCQLIGLSAARNFKRTFNSHYGTTNVSDFYRHIMSLRAFEN